MNRLIAVLFCALPLTVLAQWTNHYPLADGFNHHVYLEGFELPVLNAGPMDPAPSPDGKEIAFAARGWLWVLDLESGQARRVTASAEVDARPEWSPDGKQLVFLRDSGSQLSIVALDLRSGKERILVDVEAINLDPSWSPDGRFVYYASAESGQLELWRVALESLHREQITRAADLKRRPIKRRPLVLDQGSLIVYLDKQGSSDSIRMLNTRTGTTTALVEDRITAQADLSLSPDGDYLAYVWPFDGGHELRMLALSSPDTSVLLTRSKGMPMAPAFSHDGTHVYFAEADDQERTVLRRVSANGGRVETIDIADMDWGTRTGKLLISSRVDGQPATVRLNVLDARGHPLVPDSGAVRFDGQNGRVFFYSGGEIELTVPAGEVTVSAVQGFETAEVTETVAVGANGTTRVDLGLERVWDASARGWYSGDNHFHLNYGGIYRLEPADLLPEMAGEALDFAYPLLANLHNRFLQQDLWGWTYAISGGPIIEFGQEVRSHFLGHIQLIGTGELFWPWIWGPYYQLYEKDDRPNAEALRFARDQGGLGGYVHPVAVEDPFTEETASSVPINFVADAVLGEADVIELACLWTDEVGTGSLWHNVLNLGIPLAASAGSDVMSDYFRTMALGSTRVYVRPDGDLTTASYLRALADGRSFVSNGPMLEFEAGGAQPGQVIDTDGDEIRWTLDVHSPLPVDSVEIFVNGTAMQTLEGMAQPGTRRYEGRSAVPAGGWISARVLGPDGGWPAMDSYLYAESSPIWFGEKGSTDPEAARESAKRLLMVLEQSETRLKDGYGSDPIPRLLAQFQAARVRLQAIIDG
jgi:TolB protein